MSRRLAVPIATMLAALALGGCGGSDSNGGRSGSNAPQEAGANVGKPPSVANCKDWKAASPQERYGTIEDLREFAGGPVEEGGHGATLPDDDAYKVLERWCRNYYARGFKLYKLYSRAAAFTPR